MSVAAYTDAVMLFVGPSHYWLNILIYRSCASRATRSPKRGPLALSRNACPNSILGGQMLLTGALEVRPMHLNASLNHS